MLRGGVGACSTYLLVVSGRAPRRRSLATSLPQPSQTRPTRGSHTDPTGKLPISDDVSLCYVSEGFIDGLCRGG